MIINIEHTRWDTFIRQFIFSNKSWEKINITNDIIKFSIKENIEDTEYVIQSIANITDWINWVANLKIDWDDLNIDIKEYFYDIERKRNNWEIKTLMKWQFYINYDITND